MNPLDPAIGQESDLSQLQAPVNDCFLLSDLQGFGMGLLDKAARLKHSG